MHVSTLLAILLASITTLVFAGNNIHVDLLKQLLRSFPQLEAVPFYSEILGCVEIGAKDIEAFGNCINGVVKKLQDQCGSECKSKSFKFIQNHIDDQVKAFSEIAQDGGVAMEHCDKQDKDCRKQVTYTVQHAAIKEARNQLSLMPLFMKQFDSMLDPNQKDALKTLYQAFLMIFDQTERALAQNGMASSSVGSLTDRLERVSIY